MCSDADHGGATALAAIHPDIIQSHILNRLDGPTLASTSCASAQFLSLCAEDLLWRQICNATWPSTAHPTVRAAISAFPSAHRSFYSDSFPAVARQGGASPLRRRAPPQQATQTLISAVDVYCDDKLIYSRVKETETRSGWFQSSPFRIDLVDPKEAVAAPLRFDGEDGACMELARERLRLSWILIDPAKGRAVNVASAAAVEARRHWLTEDIQLRYATVVDAGNGELVQCAAVVTCGGKDGGELQVREISMQVEDMEGKILTGSHSLGILDAAMEGRRLKSHVGMQREAYQMFLRMKIQSRERKQRRERSLDIVCIAAGVAIFVAIWTFLLSR
ncbi:F-box protein At2g27310-like [Salvia miltiorrhiza]|uniref:F-box protein At2g27310-like n=1 Tax=Salvia miltiorrhiza TaxID=226208 RepID=UPI0025AB889E|nr:F-box protein At2g27310-like [Salvia miltiorrhiza]